MERGMGKIPPIDGTPEELRKPEEEKERLNLINVIGKAIRDLF